MLPVPAPPGTAPASGSSGAGAPAWPQVGGYGTSGFGPLVGGAATPPAWYPDPWQWWAFRWWDGSQWTGHTYEPPILEAPAPPGPIPTFPLYTGLVGVAILAASLLIQKFVLPEVLSWLPVVLYVVIATAFVYLPSFFWCLYVARRYASGRILHDLGLKIRGADLGWGALTWLAVIMGNVALMLIIQAIGIPFTSNVGGADGLEGRDRSLFLIAAMSAVVAAPFFEELLFRGLVLRSLRSRIPTVAALIIQGILFGFAHADPSFGAGNAGLLIVLSWAGIALGFVAHKLRRNGASMVAHTIMNGIVMLVLLLGGGAG